MRKKLFILSLAVLLPIIGSCGQSNNNESENNNDNGLTVEENNKSNMEYVIPYLKQSFTLTGKFNNGTQDFNLTYI